MLKPPTKRPNRGFTLTELLVVMAIIGLLLTFILVAARDSVRSAMEKSTYSLIVKLETGLNERLEAVLAQRGEITFWHKSLAATYFPGGAVVNSDQRAQVFAQFDQVRAEVPDVFVLNPSPYNSHYPLNFAGLPFPYTNGGAPFESYVLPLGKGLPAGQSPRIPGSGIFGASYTAAGGIYKNLGYLPAGYDGIDNDGDGYVDDLKEGLGANPAVADPDTPGGAQIPLSTLIARRIGNHTHNTARAEMLYAVLIEGRGPLGSIFSADDFTADQIKDTDNDGLPEFVDAWGEPLQFYRWPIYYSPKATGSATAYIQKGPAPYSSTEPRQLDALDPSQLLVAPAWWWSQVNVGSPTLSASGFNTTGKVSAGAMAFMTYFHSLLDNNSGAGPGQGWDRSGFLPRREYYSRPLIISSGPDKQLGIAQLNLDYRNVVPSSLDLFATFDGSGSPVGVSKENCVQLENMASQIDPNWVGTFSPYPPSTFTQTTTYLSGSAGLDDISNHSLSSPGAGVR